MEHPDPHVCVAARAVEHMRVGRLMFPPTRGEKLRAQDAQVLVAVYALEHPTVGDLGKALGLNPSSLDGALGRLEDHGYAERVVDPESWRRRVVQITDQGGAAALEVVDAIRSRLQTEGIDLGDLPAT